MTRISIPNLLIILVPPTNSKATGNSTFMLSNDGMRIKYEVNVKDTDVTMAQIQEGKKGENGPRCSNTYTI
jgi:CHRD domain